jgi:hypothetical protein
MFPLRRRWFIALPMLVVVVLMTLPLQLQDDVPKKENNKVPSKGTNLIIDILSIGSKTRPGLQDAQLI